MSSRQIVNELSDYLRPPGQGVHAVSTGKKEIEAFTKSYLPDWDPSSGWRSYLEQLETKGQTSFVAMLGIPSDCGAGIVRGAAWGPIEIRRALKSAPVFDLGDVFTIPHFIDDEMLSIGQIRASQEALYPHIDEKERNLRPVSPISIAVRVVELLTKLCPSMKLMVLGGDHTVSWAPVSALLKEKMKKLPKSELGIVHFDAHTDLTDKRLGVELCFATWAFHANELLGRDQRLIQIGLRASAKDKAYWESQLGVKQIWASEALKKSPKEFFFEMSAPPSTL